MENMENVPRYGYLYNWPAVMHGASSSEANPSGVQGICPNGWHVPSDAEWTQLTDYMKTQPTYMAGGNADHLAKALSATWGWGSSAEPYAPGYESSAEPDAPGNNPSTNNATGFSVLPAGEYNFDNYYGGFNGGFGYRAYLWSTTETYGYNAYSRYLNYDYADVYRNYSNMDNGFSVRCVRD